MGDFSERVYQVVAHIPAGKVASYGTIARLMGSPRSARYVGFALKREPDPSLGLGKLPCHRVLFKDGRLCEDFIFGGPGAQRELLQAEGITFIDNDHVDMASCEWDGRGWCAPEVTASETNASSTAALKPVDRFTRPDKPLKNNSLPMAPPADFDWKSELGEL